jgi:5-methylcytosine-specific restriction endonuclease McrA
MIKIGVARAVLLARITAHNKFWLRRAPERARRAIAARHVDERDGAWSAIKSVLILLQHHKCIYCESPLAKAADDATERISVDYDVDHFRPKNRVTPWPTEAEQRRRPHLDYAARVRLGARAGYVRLAFDPANYVVACKVCNTAYKRDRFPIAGRPDSRSLHRSTLDARELPLLLFPFGDDGDDPEAFLAFVGPIVVARATRGHARLRARTVIDFFELDTREDLIEARCHVLTLLWPQLELAANARRAERVRARAFLTAALEDGFPHAACARAFVALHARDRRGARRLFEAARSYLTSKTSSIATSNPSEATS